MFLLVQSLEKGQKMYKDGYMNPGSIKWTPSDASINESTAEVTPKVMIRKSTMTQLYPPDKEETGDVWMITQTVQPFGINAIVTQMFSKKSSKYPLLTNANGAFINNCFGKTIYQKYANNYTIKDNNGVDRWVDQYNLSLIKNDFPVIFIPKTTEKPADDSKMKPCKVNVQIGAFTATQYSTWYDNVQSVYRKYWRAEDSQYTGFKRGERIITVVGNKFDFSDAEKSQESYNQIMELIDAGIIDLDKSKFNKFLAQKNVEVNVNDFANSKYGTLTITANVFQDYDIGLDMWTVAVTIILAILSVWFIVTIKCVPKFGKKIYTCCPSLFEVENTEKVQDAVETPKAELIVAQGEEQKVSQEDKL